MAQNRLDDVRLSGPLNVGGVTTTSNLWTRDQLVQSNLFVYPIPFAAWRVHNAFQTTLPGTSAADDIGLYGGSFASASPSLQTYDVKTVGATNLYARTTVILPAEYVDGESVTLRFHAGALGAVADSTMTLDVQAFLSNDEGGIGSDLYAGAALDINNTTMADKDYSLSPGTLSAGDVLDIRINIAPNDASGGSSVAGIIGKASLLCDVKG